MIRPAELARHRRARAIAHAEQMAWLYDHDPIRRHLKIQPRLRRRTPSYAYRPPSIAEQRWASVRRVLLSTLVILVIAILMIWFAPL